MPNDLWYESAKDADQAERDEQAAEHIEAIELASDYIARVERAERLHVWDDALLEDAERRNVVGWVAA